MSNTKKFTVEVREVHVATHEVEAMSVVQALHLVSRGLSEEISVEYSHRLPESTWVVTDEDGAVLKDQE